jgi:hypothetical protein
MHRVFLITLYYTHFSHLQLCAKESKLQLVYANVNLEVQKTSQKVETFSSPGRFKSHGMLRHFELLKQVQENIFLKNVSN